MLHHRGVVLIERAKVDAYLSTDTVIRRSRTDFIAYVNNVTAFWFSTKQNRMEPSTFKTEFMDTKAYVERFRRFKFRLQIIGKSCE